jgi:hypothetical protein
MELDEIYEFDLRGFLVVRQILTTEECARCLSLIGMPTVSPLNGKFAFFGSDSFFMDLMSHPRTVDIMKTLLGLWFRFDHAFGLRMTSEQPIKENLHGGPLENQGAFYYHWHSGRMSNGLVKVLYALNDVEAGDGGFICVPGSHKGNLAYKPHHDSALVVNPVLKAGDMLIFTEALVHGSRQWSGTRTRTVLVYSYAPGFLSWKSYETIQEHRSAARTRLQQDLLRPPYVGEYREEALLETGRWPTDRRSPTGANPNEPAYNNLHRDSPRQ